MKRILFVVLTVCGVALAGCAKKTAPETDPDTGVTGSDCAPEAMRAAALNDGTEVLAGLTTDSATVAIADLLAEPTTYKEQTVRIEGKITEVCAKAGCFVALSDGNGHAVNLKVTDGDVDFRKVAKAGQYAVGEGKFMPRGPHGSQVFITGAKISKAVCN